MEKLLSFLKDSPSAFQAITNLKNNFIKKGFIELNENEDYQLEKNKKYFITRNHSSIMAFKVGKNIKKDSPLMIAASHSDCPMLKLKPNSLIKDKAGVRLNVEVYGGALLYPWLDRPLSLAGRLIIKDKQEIKSVPFDLKKPFCLIPSLAIHRNREANKNLSMNPQIDLLPVISQDNDFDLKKYLAKEAGIKEKDLLGYDLYLYVKEDPTVFGADNEFFAAQHIDNLESAFLSYEAFVESKNDDSVMVYVCFDNEEVGSLTRQGAQSDFMHTNIRRVMKALQMSEACLASSMMLSIDNAQGVNNNHPEKEDVTNACYLNGGVVIKFNANQSYTSDALSSSIFTSLLDKEKIPYQYFSNRSDERGGSTLGNLSNSQISLLSVDIGLAQWAMHSCYESAGVKDIDYMRRAVKAYYSHCLCNKGDGIYIWK